MFEESIRSSGGAITTVIRNILGTYSPTDPTSMAGADWEYITSAAILVISIYCLYRILGSLFK